RLVVVAENPRREPLEKLLLRGIAQSLPGVADDCPAGAGVVQRVPPHRPGQSRAFALAHAAAEQVGARPALDKPLLHRVRHEVDLNNIRLAAHFFTSRAALLPLVVVDFGVLELDWGPRDCPRRREGPARGVPPACWRVAESGKAGAALPCIGRASSVYVFELPAKFESSPESCPSVVLIVIETAERSEERRVGKDRKAG